MRKSLLTLTVALIAMSSYANTPVKKNIVGMKAVKTEKVATQHKVFSLSNDIETVATVAPRQMKGAKLAKAAAANDIFMEFIQTWAGENVEDFTGASTDTLWNADKVIKVPIDTLGNTEDVKCNVVLKNHFGNYYCNEYYGIAETTDEGSYIYFPGDQVFYQADGISESRTEYHYNIYMYGIVLSEDGQRIEDLYNPTFVEDEGVYYCNAPILGMYYEDRITGDGLGWGAFIYDDRMCPSNCTNSHWYWGTNPAKEDIQIDVVDRGFMEDYEVAVNVYGWLGTMLAINIAEDLTCSIATGAPVADLVISEDDGYLWNAGMIVLYGYYLEPDEEDPEIKYIRMDEQAEYLYGKLEGDTITFPIICTASQFGGTGDYEGYYYGLNRYRDVRIVLDNGVHFTAGIKEAGMTREQKIKSTKTFNLMGQQVNRDATKGLLIRDGKKYIKK
jgi:hypothetical protein